MIIFRALTTRGDAVFTFSWGDVGSLVQDESRSKMKGKMGASVLPGSYEVYDRCKETFVKLDKPNVIGNTTGGARLTRTWSR